jgi:hypothetical protein
MPCDAQRIVERYEDVGGFLRIGSGPERRVPMTERESTLLLPKDAASMVQGVAAFIDSRRFRSGPLRLDPGSFDAEALSRNLAVLHITTGNPFGFLFDVGEVQELADRIGAALRQAALEHVPVFPAGLSLGGTRALRLAAFLGAKPGGARFRVAGVAIVDAPLDMARPWETERRAANLAFHPSATDEGRWVTYLLETHLGGAPRTALAQYVELSPFSHGAPDGGNAVYLREMPVRAYHEPDVNWWIENRRKSYYDMNSIDLAGFITQLRILGNERAELISSRGRRMGYAEGATPHIWSIVDNQELVEWFLSHVTLAARTSSSHRSIRGRS